MNNIVSYLFKTNAIKVSPEEKPFWLTSGSISPYFVNTQFLYGSEKDASDFLNFIDSILNNHLELPKKVFDKVLYQYNNNEIYNSVINDVKTFIENNINIEEIDFISGGERKDWFFSNIIAHLLNKPHITIFKDLSTYISDKDFKTTEEISSLNGKKVLHIADLITVAASYERAWVPCISNIGAKMTDSVAIVDRMQGGDEKIESLGVNSFSLVQINKDLFKTALELNIINEDQYSIISDFIDSPIETMREFLVSHPDFLENSLASDEKTAKRAKLCIDNNIYNL